MSEFKTFKALGNVDEILDKYYTSKTNFFEKLKSDPDHVLSVISELINIDHDCICQMGKGESFTKLACTNCLEIGRLVSFKENIPKEIPIMTGKYKRGVLKISEQPSPYSGVRWSDQSKTQAKGLDDIHTNLSSCGLRKPPLVSKYLAADNWINEILMNWCISTIFEREHLPHILAIENAFVCGNIGYQLMFDEGQKPLLSGIQKLNESQAFGLLKQIGVILTALKDYHFVHGTATIDKLMVNLKSPCSYQFGDHDIISDFTVLLGGLHLSSITVDDVRIHPSTEGRGVNLDTAISNFKPVVQGYELPGRKNICSPNKSGSSAFGCTSDGGTYVFKTGGAGATLFTTMRYSGYPLFGGSLDTYGFLVSLMSWKPFADIVEKSEALKSVWIDMFPDPREVPLIRVEGDPITCSYVVSNVLKDKWLYCDSPERLLVLCSKYSS